MLRFRAIRQENGRAVRVSANFKLSAECRDHIDYSTGPSLLIVGDDGAARAKAAAAALGAGFGSRPKSILARRSSALTAKRSPEA